jgi:AcrR family transcriptional regulator
VRGKYGPFERLLGFATVRSKVGEAKVSKARRKPKQARSKEIVRAIEEACLRVLAEEGPDALSTNRIAEVAGVNIASVYRYFPNKDAILAELYERQLALEAATFDGLHERAEEIDALPLAGTMRLLVDTFMEHRARLLRLHEDFYRRHQRELDLGQRTSDRYGHSWLTQSRVWLAGVLARHRPSVGTDGAERAAFVVLGALQGVVNAAVKERPASLTDTAFREDVTRMLLGYVEA